MHDTPPRFRPDLFLNPSTPSANLGFSDSCEEDDDEVDCPLFLLCERLANHYARECREAGSHEVARRRMEQKIRKRLHWSGRRAAALFDLAMELRHLRIHDRYRRSVVEVGRLIALASGTELRPEDN